MVCLRREDIIQRSGGSASKAVFLAVAGLITSLDAREGVVDED